MSLILVITNDGTGTEEIAHYGWVLYVNRTAIRAGRLEDFTRKRGAMELVKAVVEHPE